MDERARCVLAFTLMLCLSATLQARTYDRVFADPFEVLNLRVEITPGSAILVGKNQQIALSAKVFAGTEEVTNAPVQWISSNPDKVSVTDTGLLTAEEAVGSSLITAHHPGAVPATALVVAAVPVPGAALLMDGDIVTEIEALGSPESFGPGFRYQVGLSGSAPAIDSIMVNTGEKPVAGRVVGVSDQGSHTMVTFELVPLDALFTALEVRETIRASLVALAELSSSFADYEIQRSPSGRILLIPPEVPSKAIVPVGECDTPDLSEVFNFGFAQSGTPLYLDPDLDLIVDYSILDGLQRLELKGSMQTVLDINLSLEAQVAATVSCKIDIVTLVIPFSGPLGLVLSPRIPLGVGFDLNGRVSNSILRHSMTLTSRLDVSGGLACDPECTGIGDISATSNYAENVLVEGDSDPAIGQFQIELTAFAYAFASLALGPVIPALDIEFELITGKGGNEQTVNLRSTEAQILDTGYAAGFELATKWTLALGSSLQGLLDLLSLGQLGAFELSYQDTLARSPSGSLSVDGTGNGIPVVEVGDPVSFSVVLNPVRFLGLGSVVSVELMRKIENDQGGFNLVPNRPGCNSIPAINAGQTEFVCQATFEQQHVGMQTVVAFVRAKLFGIEIPIPLEIGVNSARQFEVREPGEEEEEFGSNANWSFEMFGQIGFVDLSGGGGPNADATFREEDDIFSEDDTNFQSNFLLEDSGVRDGSTGSARIQANLTGNVGINGEGGITSFRVDADFDLTTELSDQSSSPMGTFSEFDLDACVDFESGGGAMMLLANYEGYDDSSGRGQPLYLYLSYSDPATGQYIELVDVELISEEPFNQSFAAPAGATVDFCLSSGSMYAESVINAAGSSAPPEIQGAVSVSLIGG